MQQWYMQCVFADGAHRGSVSATAFNLEVLQMKYVGRLVVLAQAALMASWVSAGTVTLNGLSCGSTTSNVVIDASGNITLSTNDTTSCAPGSSGGTGPYALNVTVAGTGTKGTVTSSPGSIDCGATCSASYDASTQVTLTRTDPSGTDTFAWSGACSGNAPTCVVTMSAAKNVTATYNAAAVPGSDVCPTGMTCIIKDATAQAWPIIPQSFLTGSTNTPFRMRGNEVLAIKVSTTAAGVAGRVVTNYSTGDTATREVSLSTSPGDFSTATGCLKTGFEQTTSYWQQGGTSAFKCILPPSSTAWINVRFTNCADGKSCGMFLSASK